MSPILHDSNHAYSSKLLVLNDNANRCMLVILLFHNFANIENPLVFRIVLAGIVHKYILGSNRF